MKSLTKAKRTIIEGYPDMLEDILSMDTEELDELAWQADVHISTLYNWRGGRVKCPRIETIDRVSRVLGYRLAIAK